MENIDKGLTVPKWVLIVRPKIPQMPHNLSAQFVCTSPKFLYFNGKRLHWASVVRDIESISNVNVSSERAVSHLDSGIFLVKSWAICQVDLLRRLLGEIIS